MMTDENRDSGEQSMRQTGEADGRVSDAPANPIVEPADQPEAGLSSTWDVLYGVLFQPRATFELLVSSARPTTRLAAGVFGVVTVLGAWVTLQNNLPVFDARSAWAFRGFPALIVVAYALGAALTWFTWAAGLQLVAEFLGGSGRGPMVFAFVGLSYLPGVLVAPAALAANITGYHVVYGLFRGVLLGWQLYLHYLAVRAAHQLDSYRAALAVVIPAGTLVGALLIALGMLVAAFLPLFETLRDFPL